MPPQTRFVIPYLSQRTSCIKPDRVKLVFVDSIVSVPLIVNRIGFGELFEHRDEILSIIKAGDLVDRATSNNRNRIGECGPKHLSYAGP